MFDYEDRIVSIVSSVLGPPKRSYGGSGGWYEFNCPHCADENDGVEDGKYNLAVNANELFFHCWKCEYSGKISSLLKKYGNSNILSEYRDEVRSIKERSKYMLGPDTVSITDDDSEFSDLSLPVGFKLLTNIDDDSKKAMDYLESRGITRRIIDFYSIGYIGDSYRKDYSMKNRIIFQSHDTYGSLNFWVGRDFGGKTKVKYKNSEIEKKNIVFDEDKINWYEPITLVEGPFDHIVVPNSIPLLGKTIGPDYATANALIGKCKSTVNVFLDNDAHSSAIKVYKFLNNTALNGRVRIIESQDKKDAADIFKDYGTKGIIDALKTARKLDEIELLYL